MYEIALQLGFPVALILIGLVSGTILEARHFALIRRREAGTQRIPVLTGPDYPTDRPVSEAQMLTGDVVVSVDYFKRVLATLRNIFGGEVCSYGPLLDRGRREALLRMKEQWPEADMIINVRVETSSISKGRRNSIGSTEVLAYGTGIKFAASQAHEDQ